MPCYTVNTASVQFGKNTDKTLLAAAIKQAGISEYSYTFDHATGKLTLRGSAALESNFGLVKRMYSEQVVNATAKKNGWQVQWSENAAGNRVAQVERVSR